MLAALPVPLTFIVLGACLALCTWHDVRRRRIPNAIVLPAFVAALFAAWGEAGWTAGLKPAAIGAVAGLAVSLPFYAVRALGAGDAKLMTVAGAALGTVGMLQLAAMSICAAAVVGLAMSIATGRLRTFVTNFRMGALALASRDTDLASAVASRTAYRVPFAAAMAIAAPVWLVYVW